MNGQHGAAQQLRTSVAYRWGNLALATGLSLSLMLVWAVAWKYEEMVALIPLAFVGALVAAWVFYDLQRGLYVVLAGFVSIAAFEEGLQVQEVVYGLLFMGFLAGWWVSRAFVLREKQIRDHADMSLVLFLLTAAVTLIMTAVNHGDVRALFGEVLTLAMLLFYFPVKEAVRRDPKALKRLVLILAWFTLFVAVRNLFVFRRALGEAEYLWEIARGRIPLNEVILMMASLFALTLLIYARRFRERVGLLLAFLISTAGLIITQSRAYWASFLLGVLLLILFVEWRKKGQILLLMAGGVGGFFLIGWLLFPAFVQLFFVGIIDRITSLATAATDDISLVNRFYETGQVWEYVKQNPIVGHGIGTPYEYYNIIYKVTRDWTFIHNGYMSLWFKFGVFGLVFMLYFWGTNIVRGFTLFKNRLATREMRLVGLAGAICLASETLVANTSNPFLIADATLMMVMIAGMIGGLYQEWRENEHDRRHVPSSST